MGVSEYLKNIRLNHWWGWIGICAIAAYVFNPEFMIKPFLLVVSGFSFLFASGYSLNNTFDHRSDKWNPSKRNPVAEEKISFGGGLMESIILGITGLILLGIVSMEGLIGGVLLIILIIIYHVPPVRTKGRPYLDIITITLLYSTPFFIGFSAINSIELRGTSLAILFGLLSGATHPFQTAKDVVEDRRNGDTTISVLIGVKKSVILSFAIFVLSLAYFELLILKDIIDPRLFFIPLTFIPTLLYYSKTVACPSNKRIDNTLLLLRLNGIIGGIISLYVIVR